MKAFYANFTLNKIWATCSSTKPLFSSITNSSLYPFAKLIMSWLIRGHGTLHEKMPIPCFCGSKTPIESKASIVSVVALPTVIIPKFLV